ncbi:MAG: hypothetical protein KDI71_12065 [Xanthomonadales bacterium]|nr:hypothetical protein [Xanthomonadales bacterium]
MTAWSQSQRAVLREMDIPLLRLRGDSEEDSLDYGEVEALIAQPDFRGWGLSGNPEVLALVEATRWYRQFRQFLGRTAFDLTASGSQASLHLPGSPPMLLSESVPSAEQKRMIFRCALETLSVRR